MRVAEELPGLCLLAAPRERERHRQVDRQDQRRLVLGAEQAGRVDEDRTLDLRGLGEFALS